MTFFCPICKKTFEDEGKRNRHLSWEYLDIKAQELAKQRKDKGWDVINNE